jgi:hypothetical protein
MGTIWKPNVLQLGRMPVGEDASLPLVASLIAEGAILLEDFYGVRIFRSVRVRGGLVIEKLEAATSVQEALFKYPRGQGFIVMIRINSGSTVQ